MFDNIFRLNPLFKIIPMQDLPLEHQKKLGPLLDDREFYGVLQAPPDAGLTVKAVNRVLAEFLLGLSEPQRLEGLTERFGNATPKEQQQFVIRLVLDGVLEVESDTGFISGVEAVGKVLLPTKHIVTGTDSRANALQKVSIEAIDFAVASALIQPLELSYLLYNFNRIPQSRRWREQFPDADSVTCHLQLNVDNTWKGMPARVRPGGRKSENGDDMAEAYWRHWRFKDQTHDKDMLSYKVYFSPTPQHLPEVFRIVREAAVLSGAHAMKVGGVLSAMLRPDKLIVYFKAYPAALEFATELSRKLIGYDFQSIPFSYQINHDNPMVSMGVDPPEAYADSASWRLYVTHKVALALHSARRSKNHDILGHIHAYMQMLGIDSVRWRPLSEDWSIEFQVEGIADEHK